MPPKKSSISSIGRTAPSTTETKKHVTIKSSVKKTELENILKQLYEDTDSSDYIGNIARYSKSSKLESQSVSVVGDILDLIEAFTLDPSKTQALLSDNPKVPLSTIMWNLPQMEELDFKQTLIALLVFEKLKGALMTTPCPHCKDCFMFNVEHRQTSSADEIATVIRICTDCGKRS